MLINATAQVALTHHLDDEVSKSVSVQVNQVQQFKSSEYQRSNLSAYKCLILFQSGNSCSGYPIANLLILFNSTKLDE